MVDPLRSPASGSVEARLTHLAYHDPLTGLPNRAALAERLRAALDGTSDGSRVALLSIDLDDFKLVNDGLGHAAGDELLCQLARRLDAVRREEDLLARPGGDEFVMLVALGHDTDAHAAMTTIARRIGQLLEDPFVLADAEFRIGASIGVAVYPDDAADGELLQRRADSAMYQAKESGEGFRRFQAGGSDPLGRLSMAAALRRGLTEGSMSVTYQPVYSLPGRGMVGLEVLARFNDPVRGPVAPDEFIPVAEKTGVIHAIGKWVLRQACRDAQSWGAAGLHPNIGINVSPRQLNHPRFAAEFAAIVAEHGIAPERMVIELTETGWTVEAARTMPVLAELIDAGFLLALDDFGAGYSSLSRLRSLPVRIIKVDRSFMTDLPGDPQAVAIVEAILALANACECDVVCEGVETEEQVEFLAAREVRLAQGFGLARPQPYEAVTATMHSQLVAGRRSDPGSPDPARPAQPAARA